MAQTRSRLQKRVESTSHFDAACGRATAGLFPALARPRWSAHALRVMVLLAVIVLVLSLFGCRKQQPSTTAGPQSSSPTVPEPPKAAGPQVIPEDLTEATDAAYAPLDGLAAGSQEAQERQRQAVQQLGLPLEVKTRKTGIALRLVPAGSFTMGSPSSEEDHEDDETLHEVTLSQAFYCGKFEVTQGEWQQVTGSNPSLFQNAGADAPVENVSLSDCLAFMKKLCEMEGVADGTYRLLTEAQWEYASRAGTQTAFCYGNDLDSSMANFNGDHPYGKAAKGPARRTTVAVGTFRPNAWGLYDMHGNVSEWCPDWYGDYPAGSTTDPFRRSSSFTDVFTGRRIEDGHVTRGGDWNLNALDLRSANRVWGVPLAHSNTLGLRLARTIPPHP